MFETWIERCIAALPSALADPSRQRDRLVERVRRSREMPAARRPRLSSAKPIVFEQWICESLVPDSTLHLVVDRGLVQVSCTDHHLPQDLPRARVVRARHSPTASAAVVGTLPASRARQPGAHVECGVPARNPFGKAKFAQLVRLRRGQRRRIRQKDASSVHVGGQRDEIALSSSARYHPRAAPSRSRFHTRRHRRRIVPRSP